MNCEQKLSLTDNFCPNCGQVNDLHRVSIKQYFSEYLSGFFNFDNRLLRTLKPLLFKPGKVTKEYIEGKRMKYANPFQLYLHVTIIFFLVLGLLSKLDDYKAMATNRKMTPEVTSEADSLQTNKEVPGLPKVDSLLNEKAFLLMDNPSKKDSVARVILSGEEALKQNKEKFKTYLDSVFVDSANYAFLKDTHLAPKEKDSLFGIKFQPHLDHFTTFFGDSENIKVEEWQELLQIKELREFGPAYVQQKLDENNLGYKIPNNYLISSESNLVRTLGIEKMAVFMEYDKEHKDTAALEALREMEYEPTYWNVFYYEKAKEINKVQENPKILSDYFNTIISKISVALFFLLPIFTLIFSLLYWRNKYNYTEHLIFVFNVQTVFFILLLVFMVIDKMFSLKLTGIVIFTVFPFYLYKALKNFYKQGTFITTLKFFILNIVFFILSTLGLVVIAFIAFVS